MNVINKIKEKTTGQQSDSLLTSNTRRRLIKGTAVAVPVVMTLRSGAALALISNDECIARDQQLARDVHSESDLAKYRKKDTNNVETFYRIPVIVALLIRIKEVTVTVTDTDTDTDTEVNFWIYDKKDNGALKRAKPYKHSLSDTPLYEWMSTTGGVPQEIFTDLGSSFSVDVFEDAGSGPNYGGSAVITGNRFSKDSKDYVLSETVEKYVLVITDVEGISLIDAQGGERGGKIVSGGTLLSNHITGSCLCSINPESP